jgi:ketosteroid isomerase-like protein
MTTASDAEGQVRQLGTRWAEAEVAGDTDTLDAIAVDDFTLVGPFGFVLDKAAWLDRYRSGAFVTTSLDWHDVTVRTYGDTAIAIGTQTQQAAYQGNANDGDFRVTHVFLHRGGEWKLAGAHVSLGSLPGPPGGPPGGGGS